MEMKKQSTNWADEHRVHVARWNNRVEHIVPEGEPDIVGAYPDTVEYMTWYKRITVPFVSQMSASLDKVMNLFRSLIKPDFSEAILVAGKQGLMFICAQEKFLRKEPPVHGVWSPPVVVEEEGNVDVHADEKAGVGANVEVAEGEVHDAHAHGEDNFAQPHPQQEEHPMPMLHISPGMAMSPFFTTPPDMHDGIGSSSQPGYCQSLRAPLQIGLALLWSQWQWRDMMRCLLKCKLMHQSCVGVRVHVADRFVVLIATRVCARANVGIDYLRWCKHCSSYAYNWVSKVSSAAFELSDS